MRQVLLITGGVILAVSVVVGLFALNQANQEQIELTSRLQSRSQVLSDSLAESVEPSYNNRATSTMQRIIDRFVSSERLSGIGVFDNVGNIVASSKDLPLPDDGELVATVMDSDEAGGDFARRGQNSYYVHVLPLHEDERVVGALAVAQDATYIDESIHGIWRDNLIRLLLQVLLFAAAIFILVRLVFFRAIAKLVGAVQAARKGETVGSDAVRSTGFLEALAGEISKVTQSLRQARQVASEEARMRPGKVGCPGGGGGVKK